MSNPYGPPIETNADWNAALGCCCGMPECPEPVLEAESIRAYYQPTPVLFESGAYYKAAVYTYYWYEDGGAGPFHNPGTAPDFIPYPDTLPYSNRGWGLSLGPCGEVDFDDTLEDILDAFLPADYLITSGGLDTPSDVWLAADFMADVRGNFDTFTFPLGCAPGTIQVASVTGVPTDSTSDSPVLTKVRYRWRIPTTHLGSYFKITWDILNEPVGWDDEGIPLEERPVAFRERDLTVEWAGPGTGDEEDPSWLSGGWYELAVPDFEGERRIVNIRFECYGKEVA